MMKRGQIIILLSMTAIALSLFGYVTVMGISLVNADDGNPFDAISSDTMGLNENAGMADEAGSSSAAVAQVSPPTPIPSNTPTVTPTPAIAPTQTATWVVDSTATSTSTKTPTPTKTATPTSTPVVAVAAVNRGGSGGGSNAATFRPPATAAPASRYPFRVADGPVEYDTGNTFFVILAKVTNGNGYLPNYKLVGYHKTLGLEWKSIPSCDHMCKASSPVGVHDDAGKLIKKFGRQEANLTFEFPHYENGIFDFVLVNPEGAQVSEPFQIELNSEDGERHWYYMHFSQ